MCVKILFCHLKRRRISPDFWREVKNFFFLDTIISYTMGPFVILPWIFSGHVQLF